MSSPERPDSYQAERDAHGVPIRSRTVLTRVPSKWRLVDLETGEVFGLNQLGEWAGVDDLDASPYTVALADTDAPAMALHYAVNAVTRRDGRRYISSHVTGDALSTLMRAGWRLVRLK